ncbi:unnamed protein product [Camellia sinensis]
MGSLSENDFFILSTICYHFRFQRQIVGRTLLQRETLDPVFKQNRPNSTASLPSSTESHLLPNTLQIHIHPPHFSLLLIHIYPLYTLSQSAQHLFRPPDRGEDSTILQALFSFVMLVLFVATTCGVGGTFTAIDNLGQIGTSLGYPTRSIRIFISLVRIWNYLGRVVAGFASDIVLPTYPFPRPLMFTLILLLSCVGHRNDQNSPLGN